MSTLQIWIQIYTTLFEACTQVEITKFMETHIAQKDTIKDNPMHRK